MDCTRRASPKGRNKVEEAARLAADAEPGTMAAIKRAGRIRVETDGSALIDDAAQSVRAPTTVTDGTVRTLSEQSPIPVMTACNRVA